LRISNGKRTREEKLSSNRESHGEQGAGRIAINVEDVKKKGKVKKQRKEKKMGPEIRRETVKKRRRR